MRIVLLALLLAGSTPQARAVAADLPPPAGKEVQPSAKDPPATPGESSPTPQRRRFHALVLQTGALLAVGTLSYWHDPANHRDWDFHADAANLRGRLVNFDAWRFDDNPQFFDVSHVISSSMFYVLARRQRLAIGKAFLWTGAVALAWEVTEEYKEVVSINDLVMGPFGSLALGEALHQVGRYSAETGERGAKHWLGWLLGGPAEPPGSNPSAPGAEMPPEGRWLHDANLSLGIGAGRVTGEEERWRMGSLGGASELVHLPATTASTSPRWLSDAPVSRIAARWVGAQQGLVDLVASATVMLGGWLREDTLGAAPAAGTRTLLIGPQSSFTYRAHRTAGPTDILVFVGLTGPLVRAEWRARDRCVRLEGGATLDFAEVRPYTLPGFTARYGLAGEPSSLIKYGHYHGWGASASGRMESRVGRIEVGAEVEYHWFASIQGRDRFEERVTGAAQFNDTLLDGSVAVGWRLGEHATIGMRWDGMVRRGTVRALVAEAREQRLTQVISLLF